MKKILPDNEILEGVLSEFENLAAIPRPSKHEERVSKFLQKHLEEFGFSVTRDESNNIIAEVPASPGHENSPLTILQAHMDMVCVARKGYDYDPLNDPIKLVRTENFLQAEGTSLGADDGMGIAEIIFIAKNFSGGSFKEIPHGKLRIIFTTDEEVGMSGAKNLSEKYLEDAQFLINCDSEVFDEITVGSAGNVRTDFFRKINYVAPNAKFKNSFAIKISGLCGGHSGIDIAKNRANAIKLANKFLISRRMTTEFRLADISGGSASNVIPDHAEFKIVTNAEKSFWEETGESFSERIKKIYGDPEKNLKVEVVEIPMPEKVFSDEDFSAVMNLLSTLHSGVYTMSREDPELVETSANIGVIETDGGEIKIHVLARSNISELLPEFVESQKNLAKLCGFEINSAEPSPAWNRKSESRLAKMTAESFEEINGYPAKILTCHAGLECSSHAVKNPNLDIISIGTTNESIHSPDERLHLKTVAPHVRLIVDVLEKISALGENPQ